MNIRNSLYRWVFLLTVLPFFMFSLLITHIYTGRLERVITNSLQVVADAQIEEMTSFCKQQRDYLSLLGTMDVSLAALRGELPEDSMDFLDNILYSYVSVANHMDTLTVIDKDMRVVASSNPAHRAFAQKGIDSLISSMGSQDFYISDVLTDSGGKKTLVAIARLEDQGVLLGYALGELGLDFYTEIRQRAKLWDKSTFYLLDGSQQIISAGTPQEGRESFVTSRSQRKDYYDKYRSIDFERDPRGSFQYSVGKTRYITYYSDVDFTDWRIMLTVNLNLYQAERTIYIILASFLVFLCAVLAFFIGRFASRRIVSPIQQISDTLKGIQRKQDYSLRVTIRKQDELGNLSAEINELLGFIETEDLYKTQQQRLLQEKAEQDALTKVLNKEKIREYLWEAMESRRENGARLAVLFADIDDFKAFNTNYGHYTGDQVLLFFASLLAQVTGGVIGRAGGDEFVAVVETPETIEELDACLARFEDLAAGRFVVRGSGLGIPVYCCIGAVRVDFGLSKAWGLTADDLIHLADSAMYQVKNNGKHGHVIVDYQDEKQSEREGAEGPMMKPS